MYEKCKRHYSKLFREKPSFNLVDNGYSQFMLKSQLLFLKTWSERWSFLKLMSPDIFGPGDEPRAGVWLKLFQPRRCHLSTWTGSKNIYHRSTRFIHGRVYFKVCTHSIHRLEMICDTYLSSKLYYCIKKKTTYILLIHFSNYKIKFSEIFYKWWRKAFLFYSHDLQKFPVTLMNMPFTLSVNGWLRINVLK